LNRRFFIAGSASVFAACLIPSGACANVPIPYDWNAAPPVDGRSSFNDWMVKNRGEDPIFLGQRWDRFQQLLRHHDLWDKRNMRAFLLTPREEFVTKHNLCRAYAWHHLDIGYGVTITGPHTVARMTNTIDVKLGEKVLEIGTGSGYQSAYLAILPTKSGRSRSSQRLRSERAASTTRSSPGGTQSLDLSSRGVRTATTAGRRMPRSTKSL
jgi:protein-L-isoaspartate(D-aspartate) O-methyltransferase